MCKELLDIFRENLIQTPMELIPKIWFNPDHPENFSIYLRNKSTGETITFDGTKWNVGNTKEVIPEMLKIAYNFTGLICEKKKGVLTVGEQAAVANMIKNKTDKNVIEIEQRKVLNIMTDQNNRDMVEPFTKNKS